MTKGMSVLRKGLYALMVFTIMVLSSFMIAQAILGAGMARVKGDSMEPTLHEDQALLFTRRSSIERYDIVLVDYERQSGEEVTLVKRVIGMPGDDISVIGGVLYLNGKQYDEPYIKGDYELFSDELFRYQLGEEEYFLMGDNRDTSLDSRNDLGIVREDKIVGVVKVDVSALRGAVKGND